ncbi:MAG: Hsp20/alpha crystallin family protein [Pirellulales bacterium]
MATETTMEKQTERPGDVEGTRSGYCYRPNVDILEKNDELMLVADMPGVAGNEIDIRFEEGELTIHGPVPDRYGQQDGWLLREYGTGDFYRTFRVSEQIDAAKIEAAYANGVLTLHLPKIEAARPRKISVKAST